MQRSLSFFVGSQIELPSQFAPSPTILVLKTWVSLWPWKNQIQNMDLKKDQKEKRPDCLFSFWITMTLVFCTLLFSKSWVPNFFSGSQTDPGFQNKNSGCRLTGRLWALPPSPRILVVNFTTLLHKLGYAMLMHLMYKTYHNEMPKPWKVSIYQLLRAHTFTSMSNQRPIAIALSSACIVIEFLSTMENWPREGSWSCTWRS